MVQETDTAIHQMIIVRFTIIKRKRLSMEEKTTKKQKLQKCILLPRFCKKKLYIYIYISSGYLYLQPDDNIGENGIVIKCRCISAYSIISQI